MRILQNTEVIQRQSENLILGELSNITLVIQGQQVLTHFFSINADQSETLSGLDNVDTFIGPDSPVRYNLIENLPIGGIDNIAAMSSFGDDEGTTVDFNANGMTYPNTVIPKPNDLFIIPICPTPAIFRITNVMQNTIKSLPCVEIEFDLMSQSQSSIDQLYKQVVQKYKFTVTSIGADKNLVIKEDTYFTLQEHVDTYIKICEMYTSLFYDRVRSIFMYKDVMMNEKKINLIDLVFLKYLYENGIIVYDSVVTYAMNNYNMRVDRVFMDMVPIVDSFMYKSSIFNRFIEKKNPKNDFAEYQYPILSDYDNQITKFMGVDNRYIDTYDKNVANVSDFEITLTPFSTDFITRIKTNTPYAEGEVVDNPTIKNAMIAYFNGGIVDFENIDIVPDKSYENYYLIPILLYMYKEYISLLK